MPIWGSLLGRLSGRAAGSVVSNTVGYAAGGAAQSALQPEVQPIANEAWAANPTMPLPADIAAQVAIKSPQRDGEMEHEAAKSGFSGDAFRAFKEAADVPPGIGEQLELFRRGEISREKLLAGLRSAMIEDAWLEEIAKLARVLLSPAELAMMRQQSFIGEDEQVKRSGEQGIEPRDAQLIFDISGEPPGPEFMVDLWRRGKATEDDVRAAIVEGRIKLKWTNAVIASKEIPLSAAIAAEAVVRQRDLPRDPHYYAQAAGLSNADFDAWVEMIGRPISADRALQLARRGEFTFAQFQDAIARSDVRTEFAPDLWKLRRVIPPLFQVSRLLAAGKISDELATKYVIEDGYDKELAEAIVHAGKKDKTQRTHDLTAAQIDIIYESGLENEAWALEQLTTHGYDDDEAHWHLRMLDARLLVEAHNATLRRIHALYVTHKIDDATMQADLDALQVETKVKELLVHAWAEERRMNERDLTDAEIGQALRYRVLSRDDAIARWQRHGITPENAEIKADIIQRRARIAPGQ